MNYIRYLTFLIISACGLPALGQKSIATEQYWLDGDVGTTKTISSGGIADLSGLNMGVHSITVRVQDSEGMWSSPLTKNFIIAATPAQATSVVRTEYWIDGDIAGRKELGASVASVDLSGLNMGVHSITVRSQDNEGIWSIPVTKNFVMAATPEQATSIVRTEYWIDGDIAGRKELGASVANVDLSGLNMGVHSITVRSQDNEGIWSIPVTKNFVMAATPEKATSIVRTEYWIDGDIAGRKELGASVATVDLNGLNMGVHSITVRSQDNEGIWSIPVTKNFVLAAREEQASSIVRCDYWFDGKVGERKELGASVAAIGLDSLCAGLHSITVQALDNTGIWSNPVTKYFSVLSATDMEAATLVRYMYWFDDDWEHHVEGLLEEGGGVKPIDFRHLDEGMHQFSWQVCDSKGVWSEALADSFNVVKTALTSDMATLTDSTYVYTSDSVFAALTVKDKDYELIKGYDYDIVYTSNRDAGEANIQLIGLGAYKDTVDVAFTIHPATLTVRAESYERMEGEENPEFAFSYEGWQGEDSDSVLTAVPVVSCEATVESKAGTYEITVSGGEAANYTFAYEKGVLTVKRDLRGDVNRDGKIDISDIVAVINTIAGDSTYIDTADVNDDEKIDISDIVAIINAIASM